MMINKVTAIYSINLMLTLIKKTITLLVIR